MYPLVQHIYRLPYCRIYIYTSVIAPYLNYESASTFKAIQGQGQTVLVKVALPNINCFDGLKERLAIKSKKALHSIHELFDSLADLSYDMCFKIQRIFVAFNLSLGVLRLVMHSPKDQDTETIIKFLSKVKMVSFMQVTFMQNMVWKQRTHIPHRVARFALVPLCGCEKLSRKFVFTDFLASPLHENLLHYSFE